MHIDDVDLGPTQFMAKAPIPNVHGKECRDARHTFQSAGDAVLNRDIFFCGSPFSR